MRASGSIELALGPEFIAALANAVANALGDRDARLAEPWLDVEGAATYLACPTSRIYALVEQRRVRVARDGRRLRFRAEWLDEALRVDEPDE